MNTQAIRDELSEFIYSNFDASDMEILKELSEVFIQSHSCLFPTNGEQTMDGLIPPSRYLNLDTVRKFMNAKSKRALTFNIIMEGVHPSVVASVTPGQ